MEHDFNIFKIEYNHVAPRKGRVLVSEPFLQDTYFKRSLVLLTEYSDEGSVGFVLNKPMDISLKDVMADFPVNAGLSVGGPVASNSVHFIHTLGNLIPEAAHVVGNIWWGGDFEILKQLIRNKEVSADQVRFFMGYSGWSNGQLENELEQNSWVITELSGSEIMTPTKLVWKNALSNLGDKYRIWAEFPENPGLN